MVLTVENVLSGDTPFCHLVIPMIIIPAVLTRTIIFPGPFGCHFGIPELSLAPDHQRNTRENPLSGGHIGFL